MLNADFSLQVAGQTLGDLPGYPVLPGRSFNEDPNGYQDEEQGQKKPDQYFFKSLQIQLIKYVKIENVAKIL